MYVSIFLVKESLNTFRIFSKAFVNSFLFQKSLFFFAFLCTIPTNWKALEHVTFLIPFSANVLNFNSLEMV